MKVRSPAVALAPPIPPRAAASLQSRLLAGVSQANADYALRYLTRAPGALGEKARELLAELPNLEVPSTLNDAQRMTTWAGKLFEARAPELALQARQYLSTNLSSERQGTRVEWRFGLKEVSAGRHTRAAGGHVIDVAKATSSFAADSARHSMNDVGAYMKEWLPEFVLADLKRPGADLWVMEGGGDGAVARAAADGFTRAFRIETPGAFDANQLFIAENPLTGARRYFFAEVSGDSGIATLLRVVGMSQVSAPVTLLTDPNTRENTQLVSAYQQLRPYASASRAIIGFKNTLLRELWSRKLLSDAEPTVRAWAKPLGIAVPPLGTRIGKLLDHASTEVLLHTLEAIRAKSQLPEPAALEARVKGPPDLTLPLPQDPLSSQWDGALLNVISSTGAREQLALLRTPYGQFAGPFVSALKGLGVKDVGVIGTAGGLEKSSKVGTIYVPDQVSEVGGVGSKTFTNALGPVLTDGAKGAIRERANGATVLTPLEETHQAMAQLRARGDDFVELELSSMVEAAKGLSLSSAFVVSDVPGSKETIETQAPNALDGSVGVVLDGLLRSMHIDDVELSPVAPAVAAQGGRTKVQGELDRLATEGQLTPSERAALHEHFDSAFDEVRAGELAVPYAVLLERGQGLSRQLLQAATTFVALNPVKGTGAPGAHTDSEAWAPPRSRILVPGTRDLYGKTINVLPLEASSLDALSIELAKMNSPHGAHAAP